MIKRQDSQLLSSSRRQTPPPPEKQNQAKAVGCMSGIFKLISKYQNSKKLLTFGKKVEKKAITVYTKTANGMVKDEENRYINKNVVPRSPMLSPKLPKPNASEKVPENTRKPPVAGDRRLIMGVKEEEQHERPVAYEKEESSEKKRQKLLEALEKCNEDLEALKMIIKSVKPLAAAPPPPPCRVDYVDGDGPAEPEEKCMKNCEDKKNEKVRSELWTNSSFTNNFKCHGNEQHGRSQPKMKPERHNRIGARCFSKFVKEPYGIRRKPIFNEVCASGAMVRNVEEVCTNIMWGEKREVANIGVMLHNHICKDLIEETINELGFHKMYRFPLHGCKRRLSF